MRAGHAGAEVAETGADVLLLHQAVREERAGRRAPSGGHTRRGTGRAAPIGRGQAAIPARWSASFGVPVRPVVRTGMRAGVRAVAGGSTRRQSGFRLPA